MNMLEGLMESFSEAKVVYMITFNKKGDKHSRPMTNFNENPYETMWFPTYRNTRKVQDIKENNKTLIIFPGKKRDEFYEIEGRAEFEDEKVANEKWQWWYLYWHPEMKDYFWFSHTDEHKNRIIINVHPIGARILMKNDLHFVWESYQSIMPDEDV